ncbi:MAG: hypothetical protein KF773_39260 [Deltaproteobacteria bacterium]|nr:hypothetical protein [Deltaproteobacteria bacterium]
MAGCPDRSIDKVIPGQDKIESKDIPVNINRDIDILFLIDKSPTMADEQAALTANFPRFIRSLSQIEGGLPNIHLGVISQDIGAGNMTVGGTCTGLGDNGNLLATARVPGCTPPNGNFISDIDMGNGTRQKNYTGSLEDTFSCIASLGPTGCGFEQHLGSLEKALKNPNNAGFLRPDAFLAVIIISDEDDCSAKDTQIFNPSNSAVGPLADFRCFEWGWECDEGIMSRTAPGTYTNCRPRTNSPYLHHPDHFVEEIKKVKSDPRQIIISLINGPSATTEPSVPTTSVTINTAMNNVAVLEPSCRVGNQSAFAMPRLAYFAKQFPDRNSFFSLCNDDDGDGKADLERGLDLIAQLIKRVVGNPCFESDVSTTDLDPNNPGLQLECTVSEVERPNTPAAVERIMPTCKMQDENTPANDAVQPCWYVKKNLMQCSEYPSKLVFAVHPEQRNTPPDTHLFVQCVVGKDTNPP